MGLIIEDSARKGRTDESDDREERELIGLHNTNSGFAEIEDITATEYGTLQDAFDYFNGKLFAGALPQVLITFQRHARALGYFSPKKFRQRGASEQRIHEIALNPDGFVGHSDEDILSTLAHEQGHLWQAEFGHSGRGHYHNREWGAKMRSIGLTPSATGEPGGAMTGDRISHYIVEGGPFQIACRDFLQRYRLTWESATDMDPATVGYGNNSEPNENGKVSSPVNGDQATKKPQTRAKFACPIPGCKEVAWAKPTARLACLAHSNEIGEPIPLVRVEALEREEKGL